MKVDVIWLQQIVSSSQCSTVQADKSDVYLLPNELDEKVGKVHNSVRTAESSSSCRPPFSSCKVQSRLLSLAVGGKRLSCAELSEAQ